MQEYREQKLEKTFCNKCGRELHVANGILTEGCYRGKQTFDYFSKKDGITHEFELCEECYDAWIQTFLIPVTQKEETELL